RLQVAAQGTRGVRGGAGGGGRQDRGQAYPRLARNRLGCVDCDGTRRGCGGPGARGFPDAGLRNQNRFFNSSSARFLPASVASSSCLRGMGTSTTRLTALLKENSEPDSVSL